MPELGILTGARATSLAGLAAVTRESEYWKEAASSRVAGTGSCSAFPRPAK